MTFIRKIKKGNSVYLAEVENRREDGKVKQKVIRYVGKEVNGETVRRIPTNDINVTEVKQFLDFHILHNVAKELGIIDILGEDMRKIMLLVYTQIVFRKSIYKLPHYIEHTTLKEILGIDKLIDKDLYLALDVLEEYDFSRIENKILENFFKLCNEKEALILDVTDTYFNGSGADWKVRKGKDGKVEKLIQIALAVTQRNRFPIMHRFYEGNISNIIIFKDMLSSIKLADFNVVILDRGMMCYESINDLCSLKQPVITGLRANQSLFKEFLGNITRDKIYNPKCRVKLKNAAVYIRSFDFKGGKLLTIFNPEREVCEREKAISNQTYKKSKSRYYGYSLIFHTTSFTESEVVTQYYEKDVVEKAYKEIKSNIDLHPIRKYRMDRVKAHVKICYLAYAILAYIQYKLKPINMSATEALENLQYAYKVFLESKKENYKWEKTVVIKKKQLDILKLLNCSV
jgi:transposase